MFRNSSGGEEERTGLWGTQKSPRLDVHGDPWIDGWVAKQDKRTSSQAGPANKHHTHSKATHSTNPPTRSLTAKLGPRPARLVSARLAAAGVAALAADDVHHLRGPVGPAEGRPLPREAKAGSLRAAGAGAAPVAHVHLSLLLVGAAELRPLPLRGTETSSTGRNGRPREEGKGKD